MEKRILGSGDNELRVSAKQIDIQGARYPERLQQLVGR